MKKTIGMLLGGLLFAWIGFQVFTNWVDNWDLGADAKAGVALLGILMLMLGLFCASVGALAVSIQEKEK